MTAISAGVRPARSTRGRRWAVAAALGLCLLGAVAVAAGSPPGDRTFAAVSGPAQSLMSVAVPVLGVLLVTDVRRPARPATVLPVVATAVVLALLIAAVGVLMCAAVTAIAPSEAIGGRWANAGVVVLGSFLTQGVAQLVGTGLGLVLRRPVVAGLATVVLPLGLWALLGAVEVLRPAQAWLTPFPSVQHLLSGEMSPGHWTQWLVVLATWGVGLNVLGLARAARD